MKHKKDDWVWCNSYNQLVKVTKVKGFAIYHKLQDSEKEVCCIVFRELTDEERKMIPGEEMNYPCKYGVCKYGGIKNYGTIHLTNLV
jgi:hypothetical protein